MRLIESVILRLAGKKKSFCSPQSIQKIQALEIDNRLDESLEHTSTELEGGPIRNEFPVCTNAIMCNIED